jgi:hypothetical protein
MRAHKNGSPPPSWYEPPEVDDFEWDGTILFDSYGYPAEGGEIEFRVKAVVELDTYPDLNRYCVADAVRLFRVVSIEAQDSQGKLVELSKDDKEALESVAQVMAFYEGDWE